MNIRKMFVAAAAWSALAISAFAQNPAPVNVDPFFATLDVNRDGSISKAEWKESGLMDASFPLCDPSKDDKITREEMAACAVPESMDPKKEGVLTVYAGGRFVIHRLAHHSPSPPMRRRESHRRRKWSPTAPMWRAARRVRISSRCLMPMETGKSDTTGSGRKSKTIRCLSPIAGRNTTGTARMDHGRRSPKATCGQIGISVIVTMIFSTDWQNPVQHISDRNQSRDRF